MTVITSIARTVSSATATVVLYLVSVDERTISVAVSVVYEVPSKAASPVKAVDERRRPPCDQVGFGGARELFCLPSESNPSRYVSREFTPRARLRDDLRAS